MFLAQSAALLSVWCTIRPSIGNDIMFIISFILFRIIPRLLSSFKFKHFSDIKLPDIGFVDLFYDFWIQKSHHFYDFWIHNFFCPYLQFLDPETAVFLQFLDPETAPFLRFLDPEFFLSISTISGSRNCSIFAISGSRNCTISTISGGPMDRGGMSA